MEKNRGTVIAVVAALVVAVISLGVAFASFSASLTINGNATIQTSNWDIHYSETALTAQAGSGAVPGANAQATFVSTNLGTGESTTNELTASTFTWGGTFKSPGDTLEYHFYIVNNGDYNATLATPTVSQPTCTYTDGTTYDRDTCPITYTVTKANGTAFSSSDDLAAHSSVEVVVKATLDSSYGGTGSALFDKSVSVSTSTVTFGYTQSGTAVSGN